MDENQPQRENLHEMEPGERLLITNENNPPKPEPPKPAGIVKVGVEVVKPDPEPEAEEKPVQPVPVAEQRAAGVAPEDTVTMAEQAAGVPAPEPEAEEKAEKPAAKLAGSHFVHPVTNDGGFEKRVVTAGNHHGATDGQNTGGFENRVTDTRT